MHYKLRYACLLVLWLFVHYTCMHCVSFSVRFLCAISGVSSRLWFLSACRHSFESCIQNDNRCPRRRDDICYSTRCDNTTVCRNLQCNFSPFTFVIVIFPTRSSALNEFVVACVRMTKSLGPWHETTTCLCNLIDCLVCQIYEILLIGVDWWANKLLAFRKLQHFGNAIVLVSWKQAGCLSEYYDPKEDS